MILQLFKSSTEPMKKLKQLVSVFLAMAILTSVSLSNFGIQAAQAAEPAATPDKNASAVATAGNASSAAEAWRKTAPKLPPPRPFKMPPVTSYKLDNGLEVQCIQDRRFPFITVSIGIKAGSCYEPAEKLGLADMTSDMLTEGTTKRKSREIAEEVDFIGGGMRATSDYDFTLLSGSALAKYSDRLFDLISDSLLHPNFPEDELQLKKTNLLEELTMKRSQPEFLVEERFNRVVFGSHPYGVVAPTPASIKAITRKDLEDYHSRLYLPNESVLVVVGDFDQQKLKDLVTAKFGASEWKAGTLPTSTMPVLPKQHGRHIYLVNRPGSVQTSIRLGNVAISKKDPDFFPMFVCNNILGGASQARLFLNIREQKGYTYGAYSSMAARRQPGFFLAEADVRTDVTQPSIEEFLYELDRIRNVKVTDKELKDAKSYICGSFQLGLETQSGLAQRLLEAKLYELPTDYLENYTSHIMAVTPDDIRRVARKLIDFDNIVIAVVGDAKKIKDELDYFGPVDVYDASGALSTESEKRMTGS